MTVDSKWLFGGNQVVTTTATDKVNIAITIYVDIDVYDTINFINTITVLLILLINIQGTTRAV